MTFVPPARRRPARRAAWAALASLALAVPAFAAEPPSAEQVFAFRPAQKTADVETPPKAEWPQCKVKVERQGKKSGWAVFGPQGQVLRRFMDIDGDNTVDQWRYYKNGVEVYRDLDTNKNNKVDQSRWLNTAGTRWGIDENEDGRIDRWKAISAEEASRVAVEAMITGDAAALATVLVTADDLKTLGVEAELVKPMLANVADPADKMREAVKGSKLLASGASWMRFDSSSPGLIPADEGKAAQDLFVYENAMGIVDAAGQAGLVQVGEMVRVGDVWKLTQIPNPIEGATVQITAGGLLMQPQATSAEAIAGGISPEVAKLLEQLQKLDTAAPQPSDGVESFAKYNADRAGILAGLVKASDSPDEKDQWTRQLADSVSAAVQSGVYPAGLTVLESLERQLADQKAGADLLAYVSYRRLIAEGMRRLSQADNESRLEAQKWWLGQLKGFAEKFPKSPDAAEALLQLGMAEEFAGNLKDAEDWYRKLADAFPQTEAGKRAAGAVYRLGLKGQPFAFAAPGLKGGQITQSEFAGKVLLVLFWSTNCKPCAEDLPRIRDLYRKHKPEGFEILGVNLDPTAEPVGPFLAKNDMTWPQAFEPGGFDSGPALRFGVISQPTMLLVGRDGKVVSRGLSVPDLEAALPDLLKPAK